MEENRLPRSEMRPWQYAGVLLWLPMHVYGLPWLLVRFLPGLTAGGLNFWSYAIGAGLMTALCLGFLRRDFDRLWERPLYILGQALKGYLLLMAAEFLVSILVYALMPEANPNNEAILDLAQADRGRILAITIVLAPLLEELIFRGGIFGLLRRWNRWLAYVVCILAFGIYHIWQYALSDPLALLYLLQYLPAGYILCRSYEKTECIWTAILLHMLNNSISLLALGG